MPGPGAVGLLIQLMEQVKMEQRQEVKRAIELRGSDPVKSAYHTGLADGKNNIVSKLRAILQSESISKGGNGNDARIGR